MEQWSAEEGGYAHMHATKPATIGAALDDSPLALAAWIGEKLTRWSSTTAGGRSAFGRDLLLSTLTLYWATRTGASSLLPYWAHRHTPNSALPADDPPPTPTAIDIFGGEAVPFPKPPRELAERYFNVVAWAEHGSGGHFPAVAEPQLLARKLRDVFQPYRDLPALRGPLRGTCPTIDGTPNADRPACPVNQIGGRNVLTHARVFGLRGSGCLPQGAAREWA